MMDAEVRHLSWHIQHHYQPHPHMGFPIGNYEFSSSSTTEDYSSNASFTMPSFHLQHMQNPNHNLSSHDPSQSTFCDADEDFPLDHLQFSNQEVEDMLQWMNKDGLVCGFEQQEQEAQQQPSMNSTATSNIGHRPPLILRGEGTEINDQLSIFHLLKAYGQAMENDFSELAQVLLRRIDEKASPVGTTMERLGHHLVHGSDMKGDSLKQESLRNYAAAVRAFYEVCPHGRFAQFVDTAILESIPEDAEAIHIVDFDLGEGAQWPPLLAALGSRRPVRLTCVSHGDDGSGSSRPLGKFEIAKKWLCSYGIFLGLRIEVDEMKLEELLLEKSMSYGTRGRDWMVLNCMTCLPHMGECRSRIHVMKFTRAAVELISWSSGSCLGYGKRSRRGILTVGDGYEVVMGNYRGFAKFFEGCLSHTHALFESLEWHFPQHLSLARTAMECLFVGHSISSSGCLRNWEELRDVNCGLHYMVNGLEGCRPSQQNLLEAREMARIKESPYTVKVVGDLPIWGMRWC